MPALSSKELAYAELIDRIRLARTPGVGGKAFRNLLQRFGAAGEAIAHQAEWGGRQKGAEVQKPAVAEQEFAVAQKAGLEYLRFNDPSYPRAARRPRRGATAAIGQRQSGRT